MSNSPKFTIIDLAADLGAAEREAARRRAEARRQREEARAAELARRAAERVRRAVETERVVALARLGSLEALLDDVATAATGELAGDVDRLRAEAAELSARTASAGDPAAVLREAENLRARTVGLRARGRGHADTARRRRIIAELAERMEEPGADARRLEPDRYARCAALLSQLEAAADDDGVRFEALHGTAEHEVAGYAERGADAARAAAAARAEASDRLAAAREAVRSAARDAQELGDDGLAGELDTALDGADTALSAARDDPSRAAAALEAATGLADLLARAEKQLDELTLAHERRAAFATALKDVLAEQGMSYLGGNDAGNRFILHFQRPGGAMYTAAVDDGEEEELRLSYAIDGEADIPVNPEPGAGAACDQTEAFLEAIHDDLAGSGYQAGELQWAGKPPQARRPPRRSVSEGRRRRSREQR